MSDDLFHLFKDWYKGDLDISRFSYGVLTLLPNSNDAKSIQQYRPICLLNVIFKIFTKVVNNRANLIANKVVSPVQSVFIKGRFILDGVVSLHEVMREVHRKKVDAILFKVDFEKAYDKINWTFLKEVMLQKGFLLNL